MFVEQVALEMTIETNKNDGNINIYADVECEKLHGVPNLHCKQQATNDCQERKDQPLPVMKFLNGYKMQSGQP